MWSDIVVSWVEWTRLLSVIPTTHFGSFVSCASSSLVVGASVFDVWADTNSVKNEKLARVKNRIVWDGGVWF
jgi:hypothetical protein